MIWIETAVQTLRLMRAEQEQDLAQREAAHRAAAEALEDSNDRLKQIERALDALTDLTRPVADGRMPL